MVLWRGGVGFCIFFAALLFLTVHCGVGEKSQNAVSQGTEGANLDVGVGGEALPPPFPHPAGWGEPASHGDWVTRGGTETCLGCHQVEAVGQEELPSCRSCHRLYPHPEGWVQKEGHPAFVKANGREACATQCHGVDLLGGLSAVSCNSCHHPADRSLSPWKDFEGHGQYVIETLLNDKTQCQRCHGDDLRGGRSGISCYSSTCHADYPHPGNWGFPVNHGPRAYGNLKSGCATANCHGVDFNGSPNAPSCLPCHNNAFPHLEPRWMTPDPQTRAAQDRDDGFHGDHFIRAIQRGEVADCTGCHGAAYDRNLGGDSCIDCHTRGVTHLPRVNEGVQIPWSSGLGHGAFYTSGGFSSEEAPCGRCHGAVVDFADAQDRALLNGQSDCYRCHWSYPHLSWEGIRPWGIAHILYQLESPLFVDAEGRRPPLNANDPTNIPAIQNSCAGSTQLSCHFLGFRSRERGNQNVLCGGYCHTSSPERVDAPPQVASRNPEDGAANVVVSSPIVVQFSEAMDVASIFNAFTVRRNGDGAVVNGEISCSPDWCRTATFRPIPNWLTANTVYRVTVDVTARDLDGMALLPVGNSWTFTTDGTPPQVVSVVPADGSANVSVNTDQLRVLFNEQIRCNSVRANTVTLSYLNQQGNPVAVAGTTRCANPGNIYDTTIRFTISRGGRPTYLLYQTEYTARYVGGVQDLGGNADPVDNEAYPWSFTTESAPEPWEE